MKDGPLTETHGGRPTCGAYGKRRKSPFRNPAGFRTDHVGIGRCWLHAGRPITHGRYSTLVRAIAKRRNEGLYEALRTDPEIESLREEIALQRSILTMLPEFLPSGNTLERHNQAVAAMQIAEAIGRNVVRMVQVTVAKQQRVTKSDIEELCRELVSIVCRHVPDMRVIEKIGNDLRMEGISVAPS